MATYTAGDQINRALRMLGVLAEGEIPSASASADALMALNQMIDSWSTESLSVFASTDQTFTWPAGEVSRTLGPTGDFVGDRPISLDDSTYYKVANLSYPIQMISQAQYDAIVLKSSTSPYPQVLFVNMDYPNITSYLYPVPTGDIEFHFINVTPLDQPALLTTVLAFPPGYLRAFTYNLALEIAPEFGVDPAKDIRRVAVSSKHDIMKINSPIDVLQMPGTILSNRGYFNIYTGQ